MSNHITRLLEENPVSRLSPENLSIIRAHIKDCPDCRQAYEAAQVAGDLLKTHASETAEPSLFFHTRVMAALRESRANTDRPLWLKLWNATWLPISAMVTMVLVLLAMTFIYGPLPELPSSSIANYRLSDDHVIFGNGDPLADEPMSNGQVLATIFSSEDAYGSYE